MVKQNEVHQIVKGFSRNCGKDSVCCACGSVTLITSSNRMVLVDCGSPWSSEDIVQGLHDRNVRCDDITDVVVTHGHSDHCGCLSLFKSARFLMDCDCAVNCCEYSAFPDCLEIASQVTVIRTPGHTDHDLSVIVDGTSNGTVIIAGDIVEDGNKDQWKINSKYPEQQKQSREKIFKIADWIVPGHGEIFENKRRVSKT